MGVKLVGYILFYCNLYALTLVPIIFQAAASIGDIFSVKWFCVQLPPLLQSIMIFLNSFEVSNFYENQNTASLAADSIARTGSA